MRVLQIALNTRCGRVRAAEHAPRGPFKFLERTHGLAEIVERGAGVKVERPRVNCPYPERGYLTLPENASRHGYRFAQQCLGFFEVPQKAEGFAVVVLASGLSRVAVEPAPKRRRRREPAVRFTAPLSERHAVQGQYDDQQNRRP